METEVRFDNEWPSATVSTVIKPTANENGGFPVIRGVDVTGNQGITEQGENSQRRPLEEEVFNDDTELETKGDGSVTVPSLLGLLNQQGKRCALTGRPLTPSTCTLDHIDPLSQGGEHNMGNVQLIVPEANAAKGTMPQAEFVQLCIDVATHWKRRLNSVESR